MCFFFNDTATTEIYTLSLHDALPICEQHIVHQHHALSIQVKIDFGRIHLGREIGPKVIAVEADVQLSQRNGMSLDCFDSDRKKHTSELQSRQYLVCRLLLEKKKKPTE